MARITLKSLSEQVESKFNTLAKSIDDLAHAVAVGFAEVHEKFAGVNEQISGLSGEVGGIKSDLATVKADISVMKGQLSRLETGQEDIILRLDSKANKIDQPDFPRTLRARK